jgi:DeoR/GlpR family transcriptional regulator of sugar metabolism
VLLLDHTKFKKVAFVTIAPLSSISKLITDEMVPAGMENELKNNNIEILICN